MLAIHSRWRRSYGILLLATAVVVAAADFLFYGHPIGWSTALFTAVFLGVLCARDARFLAIARGRQLSLTRILYTEVEPELARSTLAIAAKRPASACSDPGS